MGMPPPIARADGGQDVAAPLPRALGAGANAKESWESVAASSESGRYRPAAGWSSSIRSSSIRSSRGRSNGSIFQLAT